jgi:vacuolar protein sorting-associated protein IST1
MIQKLKVQTPDPVLVNHYLSEIAQAYKIDWTPVEDDLAEATAHPSARDQVKSVPPYSPEVIKQPFPQPPAGSAVQFPTIPQGSSAVNDPPSSGPDFDELEKRFEALKKKK